MHCKRIEALQQSGFTGAEIKQKISMTGMETIVEQKVEINIPLPKNYNLMIRILIVDDEPSARNILQMLIEKYIAGNKEIKTCASPEEALKRFLFSNPLY
ncbi:MAG: hypothetical protein IPK57_17640 [Chitinophagaceae bacterium]|nr:hypothetical protein [Chitinophagaceae bacterium]